MGTEVSDGGEGRVWPSSELCPESVIAPMIPCAIAEAPKTMKQPRMTDDLRGATDLNAAGEQQEPDKGDRSRSAIAFNGRYTAQARIVQHIYLPAATTVN